MYTDCPFSDCLRVCRILYLAYLRWQSKVDSLFTRARDIVPVNKRTSPVQDPSQAVALTSYSSPEVRRYSGFLLLQFLAEETFIRLDRSQLYGMGNRLCSVCLIVQVTQFFILFLAN